MITSTSSPEEVVQRFTGRASSPTAFTIRSLVGRFEELGSLADRPGRGAHPDIRTEDNVESVRQMIRLSQLAIVPA
ncbi:hypothetical protein TNIN_273341 [Trichonephila inaurata madagascariensis]|uniref:DUF4817 domain-containing protein n=1 Tax=Trichonephila inaurata madagascariensis TaxID=2747483 RepID=A0A8X6KNB6_9ARAC|nr:hypothetical protein TNIN_273341 [Trichonephila inaurata madagascariensis]